MGKVIHVPIRAGCWQAVNGVWVPRPSHCAGNCEVSWSVCREWRMSWGVQGVATSADEAFIDKNIHTLYSCCQSFEWESLSCRAVKNVEESLMFVGVKTLSGALFARTKRFSWRTGGLCACVRTSLTPQAFQLLSASSGQGLKALWSTHTNTVSGPVPSLLGDASVLAPNTDCGTPRTLAVGLQWSYASLSMEHDVRVLDRYYVLQHNNRTPNIFCFSLVLIGHGDTGNVKLKVMFSRQVLIRFSLNKK